MGGQNTTVTATATATMQFEDPDSTASGILPSNKSYRPTQGAINHNEDTEFNDALRARGVLPPKAGPQRSPSPDFLTASESRATRIETADLSDDDDLLDLEDDIPQAILEKYRAERMQEVSKLQKTRRFGSVLPIGREEYTREITEASKADIDVGGQDEQDEGEFKGKGTGVVCFLWKDSVPESQLLGKHLDKLAAAYPSTKFVSIRGDMCIANYPDKNIPTLLLYRRGNLIKQLIGLGKDVGLKGMQTSVLDVEALLTIFDAVDPFLKVAPTETQRPQAGDESDDEDEGATRSRIRQGDSLLGTGRRSRDNDTDDELDI